MVEIIEWLLGIVWFLFIGGLIWQGFESKQERNEVIGWVGVVVLVISFFFFIYWLDYKYDLGWTGGQRGAGNPQRGFEEQ